jgi:acyl-CoA thioester hydrolase
MEEARIEFMDSIGLSYREMEKMGVSSPVVSLSVEYKKQVEFEDKIEIRLSVIQYNGAVLELEYEFYNLTKDEICTTATSKHCFIHDNRIVSLKKELPKLDADLKQIIE